MKIQVYIIWKRALVAFGLAVLPLPALGHGGGLNAEGCHTNRKTGDYHCHRSASPAPAARPPASSAPSRNEIQRAVPTIQRGGSWSYKNCTEARAAGAAPVRRGEPGYGSHLDRDSDGVGCE